MAIYIVDANGVIRRFIIEPYTPEVRALLARMYQGDDLYVPEFCLLECVNVL